MIERVDEVLKGWVGEIEEDVVVSFDPPTPKVEKEVVHLYLYRLGNCPQRQSGRHSALQICLEYLVLSCSKSVSRAHQILGNLVFAAMENPQYEVDFETPSSAIWQSFGLPPQPCFMLRLPLTLPRGVEVPKVKSPLQIKDSTLVPFQGQVTGPDGLPLCGAEVEIQGTRLSARTDGRGWFAFEQVPARSVERGVTIRAKGKAQAFKVGQLSTDAGPLVIHFDSWEG